MRERKKDRERERGEEEREGEGEGERAKERGSGRERERRRIKGSGRGIKSLRVLYNFLDQNKDKLEKRGKKKRKFTVKRCVRVWWRGECGGVFRSQGNSKRQ